MVVELGEGEGTSGSGVAAGAQAAGTADGRSSLRRCEKLRTGLMQNILESVGSASYRTRSRELPNISNCHVCDGRMTNKGKDKLVALDSEWRILLLCEDCYNSIESARICSYCFKQVSEESSGCQGCQRRIHKACILNYPGLAPCTNPSSGSFTCIDCWVPRSLANSNGGCRSRNPSGGSKIFSDDCSAGNSRVSAAGACSKSLEDALRNANLVAEKKIASAALARQKALKKALAARKAVELARNALNLATAARDENREKNSPATCSLIIDEAQLARRLQRAIGSSPRIGDILCSLNSDFSRMWPCNGNASASASDSGSPSICGKLEICSDNKLFENPDKTISEPSVRIFTPDHDSSSELSALGENVKVEKDSSPRVKQLKDNGKDGLTGTSEEVFEAGPLEKVDCKHDKVEVPVKEEEASCSNNLVTSSGNDNKAESGSQPYQKKDELDHKVANNGGSTCQLTSDRGSSMLGNKRQNESDMYLRKYSKRHSSFKAVLARKTKLPYEALPLESQVSATELPCL